jgi:alkylresorcinol/alkylpyrone synthase
MSTIAAVAPLLPHRVYTQAEITAELATFVGRDPASRALLARLHGASGIDTRHLALPLEEYRGLGSFTDANDAFIELGVDLGERAVRAALETAGLAAREVDFLLYTSVTGISAPSLDALIAPRVGLRADVKRLPSFGLGCVAGASGLARVHDYLLGHPDGVAVLLSVELCSLTFQRDDDSLAGLVACGLFGDGATAVVMLGERRARRWREDHPGRAAHAPEVVDTASLLYPGTEDDLGWRVGASGFRIVLSARLPEIIDAHLADDVARFLHPHGLKAGDIGTWVGHAGGPKILEAMAGSLDLPDGALDLSWRCLARAGNLSSSSVLHVLADTIAVRTLWGGGDAVAAAPDAAATVAYRQDGAAAGAPGGDEVVAGQDGVLMAFGPGLSAELVLLRWPGAREKTSAGLASGVGEAW